MSVALKFGGTSVRDAEAVTRLIDIVRREPRPCVVVVSALAGVTDQLVELAARAGTGAEPPPEVIGELQARHLEMIRTLVDDGRREEAEAAVEVACTELRTLLHAIAVLHELSPRSSDAILSFGELMSSRLVAAALASASVLTEWVDASQVVVTNQAHGRALPLMDPTTARIRERIRPRLEDGVTVVLGGFVGATPDGVRTTLGRGGSDYSAALVGAALDVEEVQIWTDVDGMLTADPRVVPDARLVPSLTFAEASELAYFGAKVLHPATIQPAVTRNIPVRILNSRRPDGRGTEIAARADRGPSAVAALACKRGLTVIEIASARMLMAHGFLRRLFEVFDRFEIPVDVVTTSEVDVSVTIDDATRLDALVGELSTFADVTTVPDMAVLCVVGERLHDDPALFPRVVEALRGLPCRMVSQAASRRNLTFVLRERDLTEAMTRLHDHFFARPVGDPPAARGTEPDVRPQT